MCRSSKGNQTASQSRLAGVQPNTTGPDGGGAPAPPPRFDGVPEHVPALTFIVERRIENDDFINGANTYHTTCGLNPQTIQSMGHLIDLLSAATSHLGRFRIVTHANGDDLIIPLFGHTNVQADQHTFKEHLRGFAESDERGLKSILGLGVGGHFHGWSESAIMAMIRTSNATLLTPFGLEQSGLPPGSLQKFILYCCDRAMVNRDFVRRGDATLSASEKSSLLHAVDVLINMQGTAANLQPLKTYLTQRTMSDLGLANADIYKYRIPAGSLNLFLLAGNAATAIEAGFRGKLNTVKGRLDESSTIDIRGCRAGTDTDYMRAVQEFFGRTEHKPTITAPRQFQYFGPCAFSTIANNTELHTLTHTGANAANNRTAFNDWAERSKVYSSHKTYWLTQLNGSVIRFCGMQWRTAFPQLPLQTPGLTAFAALSFKDAITRTGAFFNVPGGSVPSGAPLDTVHTFVTTKLNGYSTHLLATVNDGNKAALHPALHNINQELGLALVPAAPPNPLQVSHITGYQTALINHIEANRLPSIRNFMTSCRQRIEDANDPGINYYMVHAGLPVFLFVNNGMVAAHRVTANNNRIVVHSDFADAAYRQWVPMLWAETLPANSIGTSHVTDNDARRFAAMVRDADGGNTTITACPHPDYFDKIATVTNTQDRF